MTKRKFVALAAGLFLLIAAAACSSNKKPADQAIKSAQAAYDAVKGDALKYAPDKASAVEASLSMARASYEKGDYDAALNTANNVMPAVTDLTAAAATNKEELTRTWGDLSIGVPKMVDAITTRVNFLSKSKALPAGMDSTVFEGARSALANLTRMWSDATSAYKSGNITTAVATATTAKDQAVRIMSSLGMPIPLAASD